MSQALAAAPAAAGGGAGTGGAGGDAAPDAAAAPLRLAVVAGPQLRRWQRDALQALAAAGEAVPVVLPAAVPPRPAPPWPGRYAAAVCAGCPALDMVEIPVEWAGQPPAEIDAVLVLDGAPPPLAPRLGTWRFRFGAAPPGELPGLREMARGSRSIALALQAAGTPLHAAVVKTRRSHRLTLQAVLEAAPALLLGACRRARRGLPHLAPPARPDLPAAGAAAALLGQARRMLASGADRLLRRDVWSIGLLPIGMDALLAGAPLPPPRWLPPPAAGRFHADPFPLELDGRTHLLFEMWDEAAQRGWIACTPLDGDPAAAPVALDLGCHMSYPMVFRWQGATWCAPEVSAIGGLRLFRMGATPLDWTPVATVLDGLRLVDPTLFEHDGRWWLLAGLEDAGPDTDLHAWHAPGPLGPWVPHALNPVVTDVHAARPAGAVFRHAGALFRPGQDCAAGYGAAVVLHCILRLDPEAYAETAVRRLEPGRDWPWPDGLHTFNLLGDGLLIDAKRRVADPFQRVRRGGAG